MASSKGRQHSQAVRYRESLPALHADVEMLVNVGGIQRTEAEYDDLLASAGFRPARTVPLGDVAQFSVLEAEPPSRWPELDLDRSRTIEARLQEAGLDGGRFD